MLKSIGQLLKVFNEEYYYVWEWMLTKFTMVIILQYILMLYVNYIPIKKHVVLTQEQQYKPTQENRELINRDRD